MSADTLAAVAAAFGGVNLLTLLAISFHAGRWMGRADEKFRSIERTLGGWDGKDRRHG